MSFQFKVGDVPLKGEHGIVLGEELSVEGLSLSNFLTGFHNNFSSSPGYFFFFLC